MSREIHNYLLFYGPLPKPRVPVPPETWPIIEHEPEHIPEVPPDLNDRPASDEERQP